MGKGVLHAILSKTCNYELALYKQAVLISFLQFSYRTAIYLMSAAIMSHHQNSKEPHLDQGHLCSFQKYFPGPAGTFFFWTGSSLFNILNPLYTAIYFSIIRHSFKAFQLSLDFCQIWRESIQIGLQRCCCCCCCFKRPLYLTGEHSPCLQLPQMERGSWGKISKVSDLYR